MESVVDYWKPNCSWSSALHHCPIQSDCSSECQGGGYISQSSGTHHYHAGSVCEGGHKVKVSTLYSCNIVAVKTSPNGVSTSEFDICVIQNEWLNNPLQKKPLVDSAGVSHHLSGTGPSHTHTGVQDSSSCIWDNDPTWLAKAPLLHPELVSESDPWKIGKGGLVNGTGWKCTLRNVKNFPNLANPAEFSAEPDMCKNILSFLLKQSKMRKWFSCS